MVTDNLGEIKKVDIQDEMKSSYLDYAMSVIVSRALPDVRDGLKPVQRRVLYAMHDQGMRPNSSYKKSARLVGEVLGKYHPHGDSSVYAAQVRMAQPFSMRYTLVDGQGNYGSVDGDPAAAMRYTECKLSPITESLLGDIEKETIDWVDNFDQSLKEPSVLPAILPNLLVNGASGIAVGMATNIPPHNLSEICDGVTMVIENPEANVDDLMKVVKGPDFPTGAEIWGLNGIRDAFANGRGRVMVQAKHIIEDVKKLDRQRLVFTEIPYQVNKASLVMKIAELIKAKKLEGVSEVRDESDRKGMRVVLELRKGASSSLILNNLYKQTQLRSSFSVNMIALVDGTPQILNLKQSINHYISFREEVIRRRAEYDLKRAKARLHVLEGLRIAIKNLDKVIELIRASEDVETARNALMTEFDLSEIQSQAILDMQLRRLAALEIEKIENEFKELSELVEDLEDLLSNQKRIFSVIKTETLQLKRKYGEDRRTKVNEMDLKEWKREDMEPSLDVVITLSKGGYVKRILETTYRAQHRGGKGKVGQKMTKDGDVVPYIQVANTHDTLLFFTDKGRVFSLRVFELSADQSRTSRGTPVSNIINLAPNEKVTAMLSVTSLLEDTYLLMVTKAGKVKRMHLPLLRNINRGGLNTFKLSKDDELISVSLADADEDLTIITREGMSIRFPSSQVRPTQRGAGGIRGIKMKTSQDVVVYSGVVNDEGSLLIIGRRGIGKLSEFRNYRVQNRGGSGVLTLKVTDKTGKIAGGAVVTDEVFNAAKDIKEENKSKDKKHQGDGFLFILTDNAQIIRTHINQIRRAGRVTQGVTIVKPNAGDAISGVFINFVQDKRKARKIVDIKEIEKNEEFENSDLQESNSEDKIEESNTES
ncbi:MAG: DNA gyrase subunit A [Chloroflexi bacterium]|nr:DNA gyrase subunit A [Chloroflexota bacterium]|tara:strand:- start:32203 stop:34833 length:2631 start_codon:yes stop_codon:yes gene_type:complete